MGDIEVQFEQAKTIVRTAPCSPSISYLQRQMRIGYNRAARLMDILVEENVVERDAKEPWKLRVI